MKLYFVHGNPGRKSDWDYLISKLPKDLECISVDAYSEAWIQDIKMSREKVAIVAHSWGCYRVLKSLTGFESKIERVFLLNPYLQPEQQISPAVRTLLAAPMLGDFLLKANHKKSYLSFFENMIHPQTIKDNAYFQAKLDMLAKPEEWERALVGKKIQADEPINAKSDILGYAYFGLNDISGDIKVQRKALQNFRYIQTRDIEGAGHNLPWSHLDQLIFDILYSVKKIGYNAGKTTANNVISFMERHVRDHADKIALKWANGESLKSWDGKHQTQITHDSISFRQIEEKIARFAQGLLDTGVTRGDRVIIFLPMSVDMYISMFAVQRIGAIAVFLDSWARSHHLGATAECVDPKAMISFSMAFGLVDQVPEFAKMPIRILYGPGEKFTHRYQDLFKDKRSVIAEVESETTALITFTTGSTGKPKGANRTHRFLVAQHFALTHVIPYTLTDLDMPAFPIFSLNSLATGVSTLLPAINLAQPATTDSAMLAAQIIQLKVTSTTLSPSMLVGLAKYCAANNIMLKDLRRVVTGGAAISKDDVRFFYQIAPQVELWVLYGSTEAEPMAHIEGRRMLALEDVNDNEVVESGVNVGEVSEDIDYKFIKIEPGPIEFGKNGWKDLEVPTGSVGEFICTGDHVCREYYNNPDAFKSTKIMDESKRVWHRTGDLAYIDKNHDIWIVGRVNNAVVRKSEFYFPVKAEVLMKRLDFTSRCAFLGISSEVPGFGQETCAVIELKEELLAKAQQGNFDFFQAKEEIRRIFDKNKIPLDHIKFVKKIPMDPRHHSKVEYAQLRQTLIENAGDIIG